MRKLTASVFLDYSLCRRSLCMVAVTRTSEPEYDLWPSRNLRHALEDAACGKPFTCFTLYTCTNMSYMRGSVTFVITRIIYR